jgi:hypothetical protein
MSTSAYFGDVQPQYRDAGCPSQCMGMNEYTTIKDMYSFGTSPDTPLLAADPLQQASLNVQPSTNGQVNGTLNLAMPSTFIKPSTRFAGPGITMSGSQMARIVTGFDMSAKLQAEARKPIM